MSQADAPRVHVETVAQWRDWLAEHHLSDRCVWLVTWRAPTGRPAPPYEQQIEEALRVGWIDSTARKLDEERSMLYFARRRPGSPWARTNKGRIARLEAEGRMLPAGQAVVDRARADGSWALLDDVEALVVPDDLAQALDQHGVRARWDAVSPSARKQALWWIVQAKRSATRAARIEETARRVSLGQPVR